MLDYTKIFSEPLNWSEDSGIRINKLKKTIQTAFSQNTQDKLYQLEDESWWFQYRAKCIYNLLKLNIEEQSTIFDVGGGNGYTTKFIQRSGYKAVLLEPSWEACLNAKKRGINNVICGTLSQEDINEGSIENILLLDVLEHIENDNYFLELIYNKLKKNGNLLITIPAMQSLWSDEDEYAGHFRRYTKGEIKKKLECVGFKVQYCNYFFGFLVIPIWLIRKTIGKFKHKFKYLQNKKLDRSEFVTKNILVNFGIWILEGIEMLIFKANLPVMCGSSIILLVKKA